jgi:death-on-curing protein
MEKSGAVFKHLSAEEIIEIHDALIEEFGGEEGILYEGGIYFIPEKAALKRSVEAAAATYLYETITLHPFLDGNKRTGLEACDTFLRINGLCLDVDVEEGREATLMMACGELDCENALEWVKQHAKRL